MIFYWCHWIKFHYHIKMCYTFVLSTHLRSHRRAYILYLNWIFQILLRDVGTFPRRLRTITEQTERHVCRNVSSQERHTACRVVGLDYLHSVRNGTFVGSVGTVERSPNTFLLAHTNPIIQQRYFTNRYGWLVYTNGCSSISMEHWGWWISFFFAFDRLKEVRREWI